MFLNHQKSDSALKEFKIYLEKAEKLKLPKDIGKALHFIGDVFRFRYQF